MDTATANPVHHTATVGGATESEEGGPVLTKSFTSVQVKDEAQGLVTAVFATLNQVDSDGDVTLPGAFEEGAPVVISSYGHSSWGGALPVGKGTIHTVGDQAILAGQFFMNTQAGRDTFEVVKQLGVRQEWSYGYDPAEFSFGEFQGQKVRFLAKQIVHEVSPTLKGAGVATRTLTAKSDAAVQRSADPVLTVGQAINLVETVTSAERLSGAGSDSESKAAVIVPHRSPVTDDPWDAAKSLGGIPDGARPSDLRSVYAHVDPDGDPELKASYRLGHHDGVGGPANTRALVMGIAELNNPEGQTIPMEARKAAYEHLAAHLKDADLDPSDLRDGPVGALKFFDHGAAVLAAVTAFTTRASEVKALRNAKGKGLSPASTELISWIGDELTRLNGFLTEPQTRKDEGLRDDEYSTLMAAVARVHGR